MMAQDAAMATVNQIMPLSGQPKRFSFHMETNDKGTRITPRNFVEASEPDRRAESLFIPLQASIKCLLFLRLLQPSSKGQLTCKPRANCAIFWLFSPRKFGYVSCLQKLRSCAVIQWNGIRSVEIFPDDSRIVVIVSGRHWAGIPIAPLLDRRPK